jgi:hypothetical protein
MTKRLLAASLLLVPLLRAQESAPESGSITQRDLRADLFFLAGDGMRGRLTATPENLLAAEFIKSRFERMGLKPAGPDGSYFQIYNLSTASLGEGSQLDVAAAGQAVLRYRSGQEFYPHRWSASGRVRGALTFAGFGISAPELSHDDYRGDAAKGRIVLVLDHEPGERDAASPFDGLVSAEASSPLRKALAAQDRGAIGMLIVTDAHNHPEPASFEAAARAYWPDRPPRIERYAPASLVDRVRIPVAQVSPALAEILLPGTGRSLEELARSAETARGGAPVPIPAVEVELTAAVSRHVVPDRNVLALVEGSDPRLKDEWVIVCAHLDHNGARDEEVLNGADDDGSGTVALLEIAEAYALAARAGARPLRSVLFAAWNSEERGLLGAWAYTERPLAPLAKTVAVLNMDMIGRNEEVPEGGDPRFRGLPVQTAESNRNALNILGWSRSADLKTAVEAAAKGFGLELHMRYDNDASNLLRRSDHWPFLQRGVPALWFHTGLHPDYHRSGDRPERINYEKMERIARLVHQLSWSLARDDGRPRLTTGHAPPAQP